MVNAHQELFQSSESVRNADVDLWFVQFSTLSGMAVMLRMAKGVPPDASRHW